MGSIKSNNLREGAINEKKVLKYLNHKNRFNKSLEKTQDRYATFDFYNDKYICELKSRNVKHNKYVSAMCGLNKIQDKHNYPNKKIRFYWLFTDGLYYWDYVKNVAGSEDNQFYVAIGGRDDRGRVEKGFCMFVWRKYLTKQTRQINSIVR